MGGVEPFLDPFARADKWKMAGDRAFNFFLTKELQAA
jgi:hypothetical protein